MKTIKTICVVFSLFLLTKNWIVVCENYKIGWEQAFGTIEETIDLCGGLTYWLYNYTGVEAEYIVSNLADIENIIDYMSDGKFTQIEISKMLLEGKALVPMINSMFYLDESYSKSFEMFVLLYEAIYWASIIFGCLQIIWIWIYRKAGFDKLFMILQSALFLFVVFICWIPYQEEGIIFFRPTIWTVLSIVCATNIVPQKITDGINSIIAQSKNNNMVDKVPIITWECKTCGAKNNEENMFCSACGKKKAEIIICNKCGAKMWDDEEFCKFCKQNEKKKDVKSVKSEEDVNNSIIETCPSCGCQIECGSLYCQYCGVKL